MLEALRPVSRGPRQPDFNARSSRLTPSWPGSLHWAKYEMHRAPLGKVAGQRSPLAARAWQVQHGAKHLVQIYRPGLGFAPGLRQQRQKLPKLFSTDVTGVSLRTHPRCSQTQQKIVNTFLGVGQRRRQIFSHAVRFAGQPRYSEVENRAHPLRTRGSPPVAMRSDCPVSLLSALDRAARGRDPSNVLGNGFRSVRSFLKQQANRSGTMARYRAETGAISTTARRSRNAAKPFVPTAPTPGPPAPARTSVRAKSSPRTAGRVQGPSEPGA